MHLPRRHRGLYRARLGGLLLGAGCLALAAHAVDWTSPPPGTEFRAAPPSALVTRRDLAFMTARWQHDDSTTTLLALRQPGTDPRPVARLQQLRRDGQLQVAVQRLKLPPDTADAAGIETAALEHLYTLVFRQQPLALFCLGDGDGPCDMAQGGLPHAQVLRDLAGLRAQAAARAVRAPGAAQPLPWQVVEMQGIASRPDDVDRVSVRAWGPAGSIERLAVHFDRAPHSICTSRTGADGLASCRLEDQHGDGAQHDHATAVVATFPGEVGPDRVLLPTTAVLPVTARPELPGFARPPAWPSGLPQPAPKR